MNIKDITSESDRGLPSAAHLPSVREMELFSKVVQAGSFSGASRNTGLSTASISRYVTALEDRLGCRLLNRNSRNLSLSDTGLVFYEHSERMLAQARSFYDEITRSNASHMGTVYVRTLMMVGTNFMPGVLKGFAQNYPDIKIDLIISNEPSNIIENNIDVDIRIGTMADSAFFAKKLHRSRRQLCATPEYLARGLPIIRPEDLANHNCMSYRDKKSEVRWKFRDAKGELSEISVRGRFLTNSGDILLSMARAGAGVVLLPDWAIREDVEAGRLKILLPQWEVSFADFENDIYAVYSSLKHMPTRTRIFIDYLVNYFKSVPSSISD